MSGELKSYLEYLDACYEAITKHLKTKEPNYEIDEHQVDLYFGAIVRPMHYWMQENSAQSAEKKPEEKNGGEDSSKPKDAWRKDPITPNQIATLNKHLAGKKADVIRAFIRDRKIEALTKGEAFRPHGHAVRKGGEGLMVYYIDTVDSPGVGEPLNCANCFHDRRIHHRISPDCEVCDLCDCSGYKKPVW